MSFRFKEKYNMIFSSRLALFVVSVSFFVAIAVGQTNLVPTGLTEKLPDTSGEAVIEEDQDVVDVSEDTSVRLSVSRLELFGNTLISSEELLKDIPMFYTTGEKETQEVYDFSKILNLLNYPGRDQIISQKMVQGLTVYILSVYQGKGYAGIYIYVPAQTAGKSEDGIIELVDGLLPVKIIEGRVEKIGMSHFDFDRNIREPVLKEDVFNKWSPVGIDDVINKKKLNDFVNLLNVNPDRYISAVISRGDEPNSLNLNYDIFEADPWHFYVQVDNEGINAKREWTPRYGIINTNLTGKDDRLSVLFQAKPKSYEEVERNHTIFGEYEMPLFTPRLRVGIFGGYSEYDLSPGSGIGLGFRGRGSFFGGNLRYNLFQVDDWMVDYVTRYLHSAGRSTSSLLGMEFQSYDISFNTLSIGTDIHREDERSRSNFGFTRETSIGGGSSQDEFTAARGGSDDDFSIWTIYGSHVQYLNEENTHEIGGSFRKILPRDRLTSSKLTSFGGLYSVRGYQQDEVLADGGFLASGQYRIDVTEALFPTAESLDAADGSIDEELRNPLLPTKTWLVGFTDYGRARIKEPVVGDNTVTTLWGAGLGISAEYGDNLYANVYYSWALKDGITTESGEGMWNFNFILRW